MRDLEEVVAACGGVASYDQIEAWGIARGIVPRAIRCGVLERIRQGWVALPSAPIGLIQATRVGGRMSCLSVLRAHDIWCIDDHLLHVRVAKHAGHLSSPHDRSVPLGSNPKRFGVALHRSPDDVDLAAKGASDSVPVALLHVFRCQSRENVIVSLDSALYSNQITMSQLNLLVSYLPQKYRDYVDLVDPTAQSGLETKARMRLRALGISYRTQYSIPQVGKVDILIGERLVVELDGERWHAGKEAFEEDRRRDLYLHAQGYVIIRLSYFQVMSQWQQVETVIRGYIARQEHRSAPRHRRAGLVT